MNETGEVTLIDRISDTETLVHILITHPPSLGDSRTLVPSGILAEGMRVAITAAEVQP